MSKELTNTARLWRWIYSSGANYELIIRSLASITTHCRENGTSANLELAMDRLTEVLEGMQKGAQELNLDYRDDL